jgi:hypothetical protein
MKKVVYICSTLRGDIIGNIKKANNYCKFAMEKGVIPLAPHTIFTQFLDDNNPVERHQGISMGLELLTHCDEIWVFICGKISMGMIQEINKAEQLKIPIFFHTEFCDIVTEKG